MEFFQNSFMKLKSTYFKFLKIKFAKVELTSTLSSFSFEAIFAVWIFTDAVDVVETC